MKFGFEHKNQFFDLLLTLLLPTGLLVTYFLTTLILSRLWDFYEARNPPLVASELP